MYGKGFLFAGHAGTEAPALGSSGWSSPCPVWSTPRRKEAVTFAHESGWISELVWQGPENSAFTGIRTPDPPARSESL